jgi:hypothetical protein
MAYALSCIVKSPIKWIVRNLSVFLQLIDTDHQSEVAQPPINQLNEGV